jgi:outer membrane protein
MRVLGLIVAGTVLLMGTPDLEAQAVPRLGYINSQRILMEAPGAREAEAEYDRQMQNFQRELDTLSSELEALFQQYQQQQAALLPAIRQARETEIRERETRYQERLTQIQQEEGATRERLMEPIISQMSAAIEAIRTEGGYAIIFDLAGQSIVAADPALDLSDQVLARLRQTAAAAPPATPGAQP